MTLRDHAPRHASAPTTNACAASGAPPRPGAVVRCMCAAGAPCPHAPRVFQYQGFIFSCLTSISVRYISHKTWPIIPVGSGARNRGHATINGCISFDRRQTAWAACVPEARTARAMRLPASKGRSIPPPSSACAAPAPPAARSALTPPTRSPPRVFMCRPTSRITRVRRSPGRDN